MSSLSKFQIKLETIFWGKPPADPKERKLLLKLDLVILTYVCLSCEPFLRAMEIATDTRPSQISVTVSGTSRFTEAFVRLLIGSHTRSGQGESCQCGTPQVEVLLI